MTLIISAARPVRLDIHPGQQDINAHLEVLAGVIDDGQLSYDDAIQEALSGEINPPILVTVRRQSQVINAFIYRWVATPKAGIIKWGNDYSSTCID
jgi:hypothetical protein